MIQQLLNKFKNQQAESLRGYTKKVNSLVSGKLQAEYDLLVLGKTPKPKKVKKESKRDFSFNKDE